MTQEQWEKMLKKEGFDPVYVWRDSPHAVHPEHTHACRTAHVVLEGEITVTVGGSTRKYAAGERFDVSAHAAHSARAGPEGCRYLIGEK